jgi:gliding motility-associated-like protein
MRNAYLFIFFSFIIRTTEAQNFQWVRQISGDPVNIVRASAIDDSGNVYTTGSFHGNVDFDPGPGVYKLSSAGGEDIYILKLSGNGNLVWAIRIGASKGNDYGNSVQLDSLGNIYVSGFSTDSTDFDPSNSVFYPPPRESFILKLNHSGAFIWVRTFYTIYPVIKVDAIGTVYSTGSFSGNIDFDPGPDTLFKKANGNSDVYILKLDSAGNLVWVKTFGGSLYDQGASITFDNKNIYVTGEFQKTVDFDPDTGSNFISSFGKEDVFVIKLSLTGAFVWAKTMGGSTDDLARGIVVDKQGFIYSTGYFTSISDFDPGAGDFSINAMSNDVFIWKLDSSGNFVWVKTIGSYGRDIGCAISIDTYGYLYITGIFSDSVDFDPGAGNFGISATGLQDIFLLKLNRSGEFIWAIRIGGASWHYVVAVEQNSSGEIFLAGSFELGTTDFDPGNNLFNVRAKAEDDFILKLCQTPYLTGGIVGDKIICSGSSNNYYVDNAAGIASYIWSIPSGWSGSSVGNKLNIIPDTNDGIITVKAVNSCGASSILSLTIKVNTSPKVNIGIYPSECFNSSVILKGIGASRYYWTKGVIDGVPFNPGSSGTYTVTGVDSLGCISSRNITLFLKPRAGFLIQNSLGCQYVKYSFNDSSYADTVSPAGYTYHWNFGDGMDTVYHSQKLYHLFNHIYTQSGTFTVSLVFSNGFCSDTFSMVNNVVILPAPKPGFTVSAANWCAIPATVSLQSQSTQNVVRYFFDMGNGDTISSVNANMDYTYTQAGKYIIRQKISGTTGCVTEDSLTIIIKEGLGIKDTAHIISTTVLDNNSTLTTWHPVKNAVSYLLNSQPVNDTAYMNTGLQTSAQSYSYTLKAIDSCGNITAPSPASRTILLKARNPEENKFALLEYTPYEFWPGGVTSYKVQCRDNGSETWRDLVSLTGSTVKYYDDHFADTLTAFNEKQKCYRILAVEQNGNSALSASNEACVAFTPVVFIPTAFSPNSDGINDRLKPVLLGLSIYEFEIYDHWGQRVYSSYEDKENDGWDGKLNGKPLQQGIYTYRLSAVSYLPSSQYNAPANVIEKKGSIMLLR